MEQAADALLRTDKKIVQIAEDVGYHDLDYFTNRFIQIKGCTQMCIGDRSDMLLPFARSPIFIL